MMSIALRLSLRLVPFAAALVLLWRLALGLPSLEHGALLQRVAQGALVSIGVVALMAVLLRRDRLGWRVAGWPDRAGQIPPAFAAGAALWLLPAAAGVALCVSLGWVTLSPVAAPADLAMTLPAVALAVLLIEALPEELALRGYVQGLLQRRTAPWIALLAQVAVFVAFAWAAGALGTTQQWMFVPGLGLILGYARALSGQVWTCIGIHWAWITTTQWLLAGFEVGGAQTLLFVAFALLPSMAIGIVLGLRRPDFDWRRRAP